MAGADVVGVNGAVGCLPELQEIDDLADIVTAELNYLFEASKLNSQAFLSGNHSNSFYDITGSGLCKSQVVAVVDQ